MSARFLGLDSHHITSRGLSGAWGFVSGVVVVYGGWSMSCAEAFFAGRYDEVLRATVDRPAASLEGDLPYAIGALAFTGRLDEAVAMANAASSGIAGRFFVIVAMARAGRHDEALAALSAALKERPSHRDPARFYAHQAIACVRYFRGQMTPAARAGLRALDLAVRSGFAWGRLVAADMRGHALVQRGDVHAGLSSLAQASNLAKSLGYDANLAAIESAAAVYRSRHGLPGDLEHHDRVRDAYTPRIVGIELTWQRALRGKREQAAQTLANVCAALQPDDRRARVQVLIAEAFLARLTHGPDAALAVLDTAITSDALLQVERAIAEALIGPRPGLADRLEALHRYTGAARARRIALALAGTIDTGPSRVLDDDPLGGLYAKIVAGDRSAACAAIDLGVVGLVSLACRRPPGRRLFLLESGDVLADDHGEVARIERPPAQVPGIVRALASGPIDKGELMARIWAIRTYRPERHDTVIYTAMSRLRAALGHASAFLEAREGTYRWATGVEVLEERDRELAVLAASPSSRPPQQRPAERRMDVLVAAASTAPISTSDAARIGGVSEMTALRDLGLLVESKRLRRIGRGRSTRYVPFDPGSLE